MVDEQHKGIVIYYLANSLDSDVNMQKIVDKYLEADIFAKCYTSIAEIAWAILWQLRDIALRNFSGTAAMKRKRLRLS